MVAHFVGAGTDRPQANGVGKTTKKMIGAKQ